MKKKKSKKAKNILKLRTRHQPTKEHSDKSKYSRKGKWAKRTGIEKKSLPED